ncbi:MAG: hypothetical protein GWN58_59275 [Anaerolineae bacterium]|nr:hypothetical protein [Anaerolineae bacterium]
MADSIKFKGWQCHDDRPALDQERAIQRILAFAGIHDTSAEDEINELFTSGDLSDNNLEGAQANWQITGGVLQGSGTGGVQWYKIRHTTELEYGFIATFDKTGNRGGYLFQCDNDYDGYLVWWTGSAVGLSKVEGVSETKLTDIPLTESGAASVTVAIWPQRRTSIDKIDDLAVMLFFDHKHLFTYTLQYNSNWGGKKTGFVVYQSDTVTYDNYRVAQLHQIVEWTSADPGEPASASLSRVVAHEQIRVQARYDGSVRLWRNDGTTVDWTVPSGRPLTTVEETQLYPPSHFRLVGALHEIDVFRTGDQGHIFAVGQDPNALSEAETNSRATRQHKTIAERSRVAGLVMAPNPVLEPEDVVSWDGTSWRVSSVNYRAMWRGSEQVGAPVLESNTKVRECL